MKSVCVALIQTFWTDGALTSRAVVGMIKLIPKNHEVLLLLNWRPLTILTLTKKLYAKFLANRLKRPMGNVIDKQ